MDRQPVRQLMNSNLIRAVFILLAWLVSNANIYAGSKASFDTTEGQNATPTEVKFKLPPNHQSIYQIEKYDTQVGVMKNTLSYRNGIINYSSVAEAKGIATLFISAEPTEDSILSWPESAALTFPQQQSFNFVQETDHKKNQHITFTPTESGETQVDGEYKFKSYTLKTDKNIWSRQFLLLLISSDFQLNPEIRSNTYYIADKGHIKKYTYTVLADEKIEYENKTLPAIKIKILKENSKRMSYVWLSTTQFYLPLKIEHYKGEDLNVRMQLTQLKLNKR